jgi:polyribonucleotide nucleotidyltransferase
MSHTVEIDLQGSKVSIETGRIAKQANGSVVVRSGDSVVLVTATSAEKPKPGASFFPLTVDYREYMYAAGKFPGGFIKREGRPSEKEILTSRLIDRPVRPLFPEGYSYETQIIAMVLSADPQHDPGVLAIIGAGAALAISDIPFQHVLGGVRVGLSNGVYSANPTYDETKDAKLSIVVAGTEQGIVMVEAGANQATEAEVVEAIEFGHDCCKKIAAAIRELLAKTGKPKREYTPQPTNQEMLSKISDAVRAELSDALNTQKYPKLDSYRRVDEARAKAVALFTEEAEQAEASKVFDSLKERIFRENVEGSSASRWTRIRSNSAHHVRSRRASADSRVGNFHPRRDASASNHHARHEG